MALPDLTRRGIIRLYHGSSRTDITHFELKYSRKNFSDFGVGVYFTTSEEQAMQWAVKSSNVGAVYAIDLDIRGLDIKQYLTYSDKFIDTFCLCRAGFEDQAQDIKGHSIVYGFMIDNDKKAITKATNDYVTARIQANQVRGAIKVFDNKDQLCIKRQDILDKIIVKTPRLVERVPGYPSYDRRSYKWKRR